MKSANDRQVETILSWLFRGSAVDLLEADVERANQVLNGSKVCIIAVL